MNKTELLALINGSTTAPERIHNWQHTQMSIARYCGGLKYQGFDYTIATYEEGQPLVRADVLAREAKSENDAVKTQRAAEKQAAKVSQGDLL